MSFQLVAHVVFDAPRGHELRAAATGAKRPDSGRRLVVERGRGAGLEVREEKALPLLERHGMERVIGLVEPRHLPISGAPRSAPSRP